MFACLVSAHSYMMRGGSAIAAMCFLGSFLSFTSSLLTELNPEIRSRHHPLRTGDLTVSQETSSLGENLFPESPSGTRNLKLMEVATLVEVAMALTRRYFAVCAVLLHPYDPHQLPWSVFNFLKMIALASDHQISVVAQNFRTYPQYLKDHDPVKCSRTINVIYGDERLMKEPFTQVSKFLEKFLSWYFRVIYKIQSI